MKKLLAVALLLALPASAQTYRDRYIMAVGDPSAPCDPEQDGIWINYTNGARFICTVSAWELLPPDVAASQINSGTVGTARLGSGTANASSFLRGDQTWAAPTASAAWGSITGTLSGQTDLQSALDGKQASGTYSGTGACGANTWVSTIGTGAPTCAQPGFSNLSGGIAVSQMNGGTGASASTYWRGDGSWATPASGGVSPLRVDFAVPVLAALVWTNMPLALSHFLSTATVGKCVTRTDLTNYTQVRLLVNKQGTSGAAASKLILRYHTSFTQTVATFSDIGASEVSVATNVNNVFLATSWINLVAGAKADVFITLLGSGGDGALDPAFGTVTAEFK